LGSVDVREERPGVLTSNTCLVSKNVRAALSIRALAAAVSGDEFGRQLIESIGYDR